MHVYNTQVYTETYRHCTQGKVSLDSEVVDFQLISAMVLEIYGS